MNASKLYRSGDIIMTVKPLVYVLVNSMKSKLCDYCLCFKSELMSCGNCSQMFYCNQNCQQNDWSYHRLECDLFRDNNGLKSSFKIMIRLWLMITNDESIATKPYCLPSGRHICLNDIKVNDNFEEDINSIMDHNIDISLERDLDRMSVKEMAVFKFKLLVQKFIECKLDPDLKLLWKLFGRLWSHVLRIEVIESDNYNSAYGLFVEASVIRHSCEPNAGYVSYGNQLQVRAMKTIKPNEEITISYIDFGHSKPIRQQLLNSYFIDCKCFKCQFNSDHQINYDMFISLKNQFCELINSGQDNYYHQLLSIADNLVPFYESIYVDFYPDLSIFLVNYLKAMLMSKMQNKVENINKEFLKFVIKNVKTSHGVDHKLYRKDPIINNITLLDLETNAEQVIKSLKPVSNSKLKSFVFRVLPILVILFIIYENLF